jgi:hypothetical protein
VTGTPAGASVVVNGWVAGKLPLSAPIRVGEGPLNLELRAAGFEPARRSLAVVGGQRQEIAVVMDRSVNVSSEVPAAAAVTGTSSAAGGSLGKGSRDEAMATGSTVLMRGLAWTGAAAGLGALGFGVYETIQWRSRFAQFQSHEVSRLPGQPLSTPRDCGVTSANRGAVGCDSIYKQMQQSKHLAVAGYAIGGLLAVGAVTLWLLSPGRTTSAAELACVPSFVSGGGSCRIYSW